NPFIVANSGPPFNITTGQDLNLDRQYNERPTFAQLNAYCTANPSRCTSFDYSSISNQFIPRNYGNGPGAFTVNMRVSRTFSWGGEASRSTASNQGDKNKNQAGGRGAAGSRGGPSIGGGIPSAGGGGGRGPGGPGGGGPGMMVGGPGGGGGAGKYSLTVSLNATNLLNHVNLGTPVGNLSSSLFGQSTGLAGSFGGFGGFGGGGGGTGAGNRKIYVSLRSTF